MVIYPTHCYFTNVSDRTNLYTVEQDIDVWKEPDVLTGHAHVRIPAESLSNIIRDLASLNISHYIVIDNIQR